MTVRASKYFPIATKPKVTQADVDRGSIVRYFVKGISKTNVVEINAEQYNIFKRTSFSIFSLIHGISLKYFNNSFYKIGFLNTTLLCIFWLDVS